MTTVRTEEDTALLGTILSGMFAQSASTTNSLIDAHLDAAIDWATEFRRMWFRVNYANEHGNALAVSRVLDDYEYKAYDSMRAIDHYQGMKMNPDERKERDY